MKGVSVPSRMYNIFAAGKPILDIGDPNAEVAKTLKEYNLGWNFAPGNSKKIEICIKKIMDGDIDLNHMGKQARYYAMEKFSQNYILESYYKHFKKVIL